VKREAGFTLIELLIALALFTFAIAGALAVAVSMTQGFREQRQVLAAETAVRGPMDMLADALRNASPAVASGNIQDVQTCTTGVLSVVDSTTGPDRVDVVYAAGAVVTSLRSTYDSSSNTSVVVTDASQLTAGDTVLITDTNQGHLVVVSAVAGTTLTLVAPACSPTLPSGGYPPGSLVIRAMRARFYVDVAGSVTDGVPALMIDPDADGPLPAEPLAEGIEDMQIALGVDVDGNGAISTGEWEYSSGIGALSGSIRAARITLVARAAHELVGGTPSFYRPAAENHPAATTADAYRRRVLSTTVELRNLGGSP
jgi:prepilin-type N-terminal cleavage/methylation domain-containing protein